MLGKLSGNPLTCWLTLGLWVGVLICIQVFNYRKQQLRKLVGNEEVKTFDSDLNYTAKDVYPRMNSYGAAGRNYYATTELTLDLIFPLLYSTFLALAMICVSGTEYKQSRIVQALSLLPFIAAGFDWCENFSLAIMLKKFPDEVLVLKNAVSWFTKLKIVFLVTSFVTIIVEVTVWVIKQLTA
jgi:hypothetical protein